jgi:2-oxoglutarate dehydrogenase E2 component (dihydrolipoamide succinyltransferase)
VACTIDTSVQPPAEDVAEKQEEAVPVQETNEREQVPVQEESVEVTPVPQPEKLSETGTSSETGQVKVTPLAKELMKEHGISVEEVIQGLKRLGKKEVETVISAKDSFSALSPNETQPTQISREVDKIRLTALRRKLSERLVAVKNETAMLTTFNEVDMSRVMELRKKYQQQFVDKYGYKVGFMSFFATAATVAMNFHPLVNAQLGDDEIISPRYVDIGIAVSTPRGLMVPVIRNTESKTIAQIELEIKELAEKARNKKITVDELTGGTFTITNGGVFGSLLSTPLINPPQSAILGLHNIVERPVAIDGQVVIRPMMYTALSYDHRVIDGKDSVSFLLKIKELIENPERLLTGGNEFEKVLLGV